MMIRTLILACSLVLTAAAASAGPHKWWQSAEFREELGLTRDQTTTIEQIFQAALPELRAHKSELDRVEQELSRLIADETASEPQVARQIERVESVRAALGRTRSMMLFRIHRVLTPEQRDKLKVLHERSERRDKRDAPGTR